jgi:hypothetical protein
MRIIDSVLVVLVVGSLHLHAECAHNMPAPWSDDGGTCSSNPPWDCPTSQECSTLAASASVFCRSAWCISCISHTIDIPYVIDVQLMSGQCKIHEESLLCGCGNMWPIGEPFPYPVSWYLEGVSCIVGEVYCSVQPEGGRVHTAESARRSSVTNWGSVGLLLALCSVGTVRGLRRRLRLPR